MNPTRVQVDPLRAATLLEGVCERFGIEYKDTFTATETCGILQRMGYAVTPAVIAEFIRKGYIDDPGEEWEPAAIYHLQAALDSRRRWLPTPCVHDSRKSGIRLQIETLQKQGVNPPVHDLDSHSLEDLLLMLTENDARPTRETLYEMIRLKLEGFEE